MTATDTLRAMLDGRGVEHWDTVGITEYRGENDRTVRCYARSEPMTLDVAIIAAPPEQAIEATLGRGECEVVGVFRHDYEGGYAGTEYQHVLSCGHTTWWGEDDSPDYCPRCGRKVRA